MRYPDENPKGVAIVRFFILLVLAAGLAGCGGRSPNPVASYQPGDEQRSCTGLKTEVASTEQEIIRLLPYEDAAGKNVALGVAGVFLIVPFFFMDFKDAEELEIRALRQRNQHLRAIAYDNGCSLPASKLKFQDEPPEDEDRENDIN